ncbi:FtsH protease activity modulator HflK [Devosia sp. BK]|uniref:FtsH protease activity modulator HflK n=1 Tax=unclassified Devosia TaxID=196773 RepID=UPI000712EB0B|nr:MULTISPECIES: FtsH protease activity modulator HflK [unclassified Devosia]KQN70110.1 phage tail protein [Devosia sp. Leaf64]KQT44756.1 phage tail protein [Devosia sp. Leaf420]MDV3250386.1 FtsH protease activity modulator HflK [Devosia sp. BK]
MPWENNGGGGGRNNGGPWGQAPGGGGGGPRRPGGNTPNLEEILNRGRDQFRGGVPGGRWAIVGAVVALLAFWGVNSVYTINSSEVGVELRFGSPKPELSGEGLHFLIWPIETVERVPLTLNQTQIGTANSNATPTSNRPQANNAPASEGMMLSGDQNIVSVQFSVFWAVNDPIAYLFNVRDQEAMIRYAAESAMREVVGRRPAQEVYSDDRAGIQQEVLGIIRNVAESYGLGVNVSQVLIENAGPPAEVIDAFNEVQRARQDETRLQEEARSYANTLLGDARGRAAAQREDAAAYTNRVVQEATGEAERFNAVYAEYVNAPEVTRQRLYLETMEEVLGGSEKVLIESGANGSGVVPYLPLPELRSRTTTTTTPNATGN